MSSTKPHVPHAAKADPSANDYLNVAENISGVDQQSAAPSLGLLQLVVMIRKADTNVDDTWTPLVKNELRYMKAAVRLITEDPRIAIKYGSTLEAAMKLVGILKARAAEKDLDDRLDPIVNEEIVDHMPSKSIQASSVFQATAARSKSRAAAHED